MSWALDDVKIDPLRGKCKKKPEEDPLRAAEKETPVEAATRELYEESRGLFDLRNLKSEIAKSPEIDGIFHLKVEFEMMSPEDKVTPLTLINEYRINRKALNGCREVLDLAVEPKTRDSRVYPRLSSQINKIWSQLNFDIEAQPVIRLHQKKTNGLTSYSASSWKGGVDILSLMNDMRPDSPPLEFPPPPLLLDGPAWERWVERHDQLRNKKLRNIRCYVSDKDSSFTFSDKKTMAFIYQANAGVVSGGLGDRDGDSGSRGIGGGGWGDRGGGSGSRGEGSGWSNRDSGSGNHGVGSGGWGDRGGGSGSRGGSGGWGDRDGGSGNRIGWGSGLGDRSGGPGSRGVGSAGWGDRDGGSGSRGVGGGGWGDRGGGSGSRGEGSGWGDRGGGSGSRGVGSGGWGDRGGGSVSRIRVQTYHSVSKEHPQQVSVTPALLKPTTGVDKGLECLHNSH